MASTFQPAYDKVLIKVEEAEKRTAAGIYLTSSAAENQRLPKIGRVIAVGPGHINTDHMKLFPLRAEKGDRVMFGAYAGTEVEIDGEKFLVVPELDIMGYLIDDGRPKAK